MLFFSCNDPIQITDTGTIFVPNKGYQLNLNTRLCFTTNKVFFPKENNYFFRKDGPNVFPTVSLLYAYSC